MKHSLIGALLLSAIAAANAISTAQAQTPDLSEADSSAGDSSEAEEAEGGAPSTEVPDTPRIVAAPVVGPVVIDGQLDERSWANAPLGEHFVERLPETGAEPPVGTSVRVLVDQNALYVGIVAHRAPGEALRALERTRDSFRVWSDDSITLKFDVRHDHRSTVGFAVNPAGTQVDFLALDNGRVFRMEYDAIWEVATHIEEDYWSAEFRIPAAALGLPPGDQDRVLGLNVTRDHNARLATYDWSHLPPEFGAVSALHYGQLQGVDSLEVGRPYMFNPYFLLGWPGRPDWSAPLELKAGFDLRLRVADDVWAQLSVATDFAEVDLDAQVVNLDRFPLFLPERRPFFLSGLDAFSFGQSGEAQLFFTRRIGLDQDANPVPILAGLKVYGREGPFTFGVLDVLTGSTESVDSSNVGVARVRLNLGSASYVGAIVLSRLGLGEDLLDSALDHHLSVGVDGLARTFDDRLELSGFGAFTSTTADLEADPDASASDGLSGRAALRYRGRQWTPSASVLYAQEGFTPELGFLRRPAFFQANAELPWLARQPAPALRQLRLSALGRVETNDMVDELLRVSIGWSASLETTERWTIYANADYIEDVVREPFDLFDDQVVDAGQYDGVRALAGIVSPSGRTPTVSLNASAQNGFFGGTIYRAFLETSLAIDGIFRVSASGTLALLDFADRDLRTTLAVNSVFSVMPSTTLVFDLSGQLNTVAERVIAQARMRWRYLPGSDIFLVYREQVEYGDEDVSSERRIALKVSYRFDGVL